MSIPIAATSPAKPIAATAAVSSCASDPTMPEGQTGAPDADLRMVAAGSPIRRISDLAIRRAVALPAYALHRSREGQGLLRSERMLVAGAYVALTDEDWRRCNSLHPDPIGAHCTRFNRRNG